MRQSEPIVELAKALLNVQFNLRPVKVDSTNPHFKSSYASLTAVINATRDVLAKEGLMVIQTISCLNPEGTPNLVTTLLHTSGQYLESYLPLVLSKQDMQAMGSAISYARRYSLLALLNLSDDDDNGNVASQPTRSKAEPQQPSRAQAIQAANYVAQSTSQSQASSATRKDPERQPVGYLSPEQLKRLYAIRKANNFNDSMLSELLRNTYGIAAPEQIKSKKDYDNICAFIEAGASSDSGPPPHDDSDRISW